MRAAWRRRSARPSPFPARADPTLAAVCVLAARRALFSLRLRLLLLFLLFQGYAPLLQDWENFYTRRLYHRIQDCWNRPISGPPTAAGMRVVVRASPDGNFTLQCVAAAPALRAVSRARLAAATCRSAVPRRALARRPTSEERECLNLGSYNYLGFADDWHETCKPSVMAAAAAYPASMCTSFAEGGYTSLHRELERTVADFVGKPAAMVFNMGFATNSLGIPAFVGKGCLLISDSLNHSSIVTGARASGATVRVFAHNDADSLEALLRQSIVAGQERSHRPWRKIVVIVEGIYSMEGDLCNLRDVVRVTKKYRAYLYMDEAHSIGAMGRTGRGMCEQAGVDPADVDVLMGTFTKSFGAMGGYIAGSAALIAALRAASAGFLSDNAMSPVVCQQVLTTFRVIRGDDGTGVGAAKIRRLKDNANYFRARLTEIGCEIIGDADSPIIPLMLYNPTKIAAFSRECLDRGVRGCASAAGCHLRGGGAAPRAHLPAPPAPRAARRRRRRLPRHAAAPLAHALLRVRRPHDRRPRPRHRKDQGGLHRAAPALRRVDHWVKRWRIDAEKVGPLLFLAFPEPARALNSPLLPLPRSRTRSRPPPLALNPR